MASTFAPLRDLNQLLVASPPTISTPINILNDQTNHSDCESASQDKEEDTPSTSFSIITRSTAQHSSLRISNPKGRKWL